MRSNAFGFLALFCAGLWILGCGSDGNDSGCLEGQVLCGGTCVDQCVVGEVECDCVCIPEIEPVLEGAQGIQENIFSGPGTTGSCAASSCHDDQAPEENLDLSSAAASRENLINVEANQVTKPRVEPSVVENSYLVNKVLGEGIAPETQPMPFGGIPLCDAKIDAIIDWVAAGAP